MRVIVTCGPAYAPIDEVRRITNFSTGALGVQLANAFAAAGHSVLCLKGLLATTKTEVSGAVECRHFTTNDDLAEKLRESGAADAVLQVAALCDYEVDSVVDESGADLHASKISSRAGSLTLSLKPALKILPTLRDQFPSARIVGWKYELDGGRDDAIAAGMRQLREARSDLCVVNGGAYGAGYGILSGDGGLEHAADADDLARLLLRWLWPESDPSAR